MEGVGASCPRKYDVGELRRQSNCDGCINRNLTTCSFVFCLDSRPQVLHIFSSNKIFV